ncbi:hypothetical protein [Marinibactrum halimedae]|uniref:Uncharacterized protein n=1 Tax=Marinibactrum halimedae TaxID=1444977 RepID=A0AA37WM76_9GAMM|nr:hypothetical protein [Marinibactrum halimedae]MCD9461144.1 hypothetical protein [Marinibactrum halimedae]GLS26030.1 hypothetical protein GCM10007877_17450 [Marinibactrum halimedae]
MKESFSVDWKNWIKTNVEAGQDRNGIFKILLDEGYLYDAIVKEMQFEPTIPVGQLVNPFVAAEQMRQAQRAASNQLAQGQIVKSGLRNAGAVIPHGRVSIPNGEKLNTSLAELTTLDEFLSQDECEKLVELIKTQLRPSELSSEEADKTYRTSRTCDMGTLGSEFIASIDRRICQLVGIDPSYSEGHL